jgi:UDP-arabinose 4-epimerase
MKNKTILVTGGAGYIGSHACKAMSRAGYNPVSYDNLINGHVWAVKWGPLVIGDINDRNKLDEVMLKYKPDAVVHFAAHAYVGESVVNPGKYYRNNVAGTLSLLESMRDHGINKLVFSSTCATYGIPDVTPIDEGHIQSPINPYGMSKLMIENILRDFDRAHNIRSVSLRYFNAAGADVEVDVGESHDPETHLIPLILDACMGKSSSIKIFGNDYPTPDGTCIRDYIHVTDLADAHVLALKALENGALTTSYNLGNGKGYSIKEVILAAEAVTGKNIPLEYVSRREGDPPQLVGDATRALKELKWKPKYDNIESIIETAWNWHRKIR